MAHEQEIRIGYEVMGYQVQSTDDVCQPIRNGISRMIQSACCYTMMGVNNDPIDLDQDSRTSIRNRQSIHRKVRITPLFNESFEKCSMQ